MKIKIALLVLVSLTLLAVAIPVKAVEPLPNRKTNVWALDSVVMSPVTVETISGSVTLPVGTLFRIVSEKGGVTRIEYAIGCNANIRNAWTRQEINFIYVGWNPCVPPPTQSPN